MPLKNRDARTIFHVAQPTENLCFLSTWMCDHIGQQLAKVLLGCSVTIICLIDHISLSTIRTGLDYASAPTFLCGSVRHKIYVWTLIYLTECYADNWGKIAHFHTVQRPKSKINIDNEVMWNPKSVSEKKRWSYSSNRLWRPIGLWDIEDPTRSGQSAHTWRWGCQPVLYSQKHLFSVSGTHFCWRLSTHPGRSAAGRIR
jgi:hypothetical protein